LVHLGRSEELNDPRPSKIQHCSEAKQNKTELRKSGFQERNLIWDRENKNSIAANAKFKKG
jgi:hypothetical protein